MSDSIPPPLPAKTAWSGIPALRPSFFSAWQGVWLLTWRTQLTWQRLPGQILGLLVLPLLVYLTTSPPDKWAQRPTVFTDAIGQANNYTRKLSQSKMPLTPEQRQQVQQIFAEEFVQSDKEARLSDDRSGETEVRLLKECYGRIQERLQPVIDQSQFTQLQLFARRHIQNRENTANNGPVWNRTSPFYHWLIDFYFFIALPLNCVRLCGGLIRDELQANTLGFLITRPPGRGQLLILKYLSQTVYLQMLLLVETLLIFTAGHLRGIPALPPLLPLFLAAQILAVFAWSALGVLLGQFSKRYMALAIGYGAFVELGIGRIPTNINNLSLTRHLKTLLSHDAVVQTTYQWTAGGTPAAISAILIATVLFVGIAALLFTYLEYHHTSEMQK
ncbi:MAG: ABC transporter permease subunit [Verrucomicrobiota bacterium]